MGTSGSLTKIQGDTGEIGDPGREGDAGVPGYLYILIFKYTLKFLSYAIEYYLVLLNYMYLYIVFYSQQGSPGKDGRMGRRGMKVNILHKNLNK